ncbi:Replication protein A 32 kDa subunit A [Rhynchospora pubera]|uniref:Replication protein A 32 kDa subunit A n=1 Tax=Rhynchospora pubera TaxID=906938 RepID=A0AAV8D867_9POAL|nr:Replication protein A 32 kDa subunit A [Rhynchospora pubera]
MYDQNSSSLFAGSDLMPSPPTQAADSPASSTKNWSDRNQGIVPVTVKQIAGAFASCGNKSNPTINGVDISIARILGLVTNKAERLTDVSFTIDDGTGKITFNKWVSDHADTKELAPIQKGMYVRVLGDLRGFQSKMSANLISARPVTDFNDIVLHFLECAHTNLQTLRVNMLNSAHGGIGSVTAPSQTTTQFPHTSAAQTAPFPGSTAFQASFPNQTNQVTYSCSIMDNSRSTMFGMVLEVFQDPANLRHEHGLHIDDIVRKLNMPRKKILDAVNYLVDVGHIYSTIDENHYKSAQNY